MECPWPCRGGSRFWAVLASAVSAAVLDRRSGDSAYLSVVPSFLLYFAIVATPLHLLYRRVRFRAARLAVFGPTLAAVVATAWCNPAQASYAVPGEARLEGAGHLVGDDAVGHWQSLAMLSALAGLVGSLVLCVDVWRLQPHTRVLAVNR